jgi:surface polysaccharide O-acyltransferase-like enzyme
LSSENSLEGNITKSNDQTSERKYYLDWLRITAILLVFLYHNLKIFDAYPWHIKNSLTDPYITLFTETYLTPLGMPLFFVIAGIGTYITFDILDNRNIPNRKYVSMRFIRLMIPFLIGLVTHIPLQAYLERVSMGTFSGSFFEFFFGYFDGIDLLGGNFVIFGNHLWFLVILFLFTLLTINFFQFLRKEENSQKISSFLDNPRVLLLFPFPILVSELINPYTLDLPLVGGWNFISHLLFFICGFIFAFNSHLMETLEKYIKVVVGFVVGSIMLLLLLNHFFLEDIWGSGPNIFSLSETFFWVFRVIFAWSGLLLLLYVGNRFLNRDTKFRKAMNELVLPFYILHQTIIIVVAFFIVQLDLDILTKFLLIVPLSFVIISLLLFIIREENTLRFLFGMRMKKEKSIRRWIKRSIDN